MTKPMQTAGNNAFLKKIRKLMNDPTYREIKTIYNISGEADALYCLSKCFNEEAWPRIKADLTRTS